ncbi:hypothetical protein OAC41_05680 [Acidimicrobiales bacterium]|nr:hypothetical protein [Acidimicrobiales bacterium]
MIAEIGGPRMPPEHILSAHLSEFFEILVDLDSDNEWVPKTLDPLRPIAD